MHIYMISAGLFYCVTLRILTDGHYSSLICVLNFITYMLLLRVFMYYVAFLCNQSLQSQIEEQEDMLSSVKKEQRLEHTLKEPPRQCPVRIIYEWFK